MEYEKPLCLVGIMYELKRKPMTAEFERPVMDPKYLYWQSKQIAFHIAVCLILLFQH
jgi:hypothetical protein